MHCCVVGTDVIPKKKFARPSIVSEGVSWLRWMSKQLDMYKTNLKDYISKPKQGIWKNPVSQMQFQDYWNCVLLLGWILWPLGKDFGLRC